MIMIGLDTKEWSFDFGFEIYQFEFSLYPMIFSTFELLLVIRA
jgi:hypothetical protein